MDLNTRLKQLSTNLAPSDEFLENGHRTVDRISQLLKASNSLPVNRVKLVGSIAKNTAICLEPDFDIVVYLDHPKPFSEVVLNAIGAIIQSSDIELKNMVITPHSVQFDVNEISFDVLPARNFVEKFGPEDASVQAENSLAFIKEFPSIAHRYGTIFCEQNVVFLKEQNLFTIELIRLAKFWSKTLHLDQYTFPMSSLMEMIGIHAAKMAADAGTSEILESFKIFLNLMKNFDTLEIKFNRFYGEEQIPDKVRNQRPLVLDPVNPYNNFAKFEKGELGIIAKLKEYASVTLSRLDSSDVSPDTLFEVQPKSFLQNFPSEVVPNFIQFLTFVNSLKDPLRRVRFQKQTSPEKFEERKGSIMAIKLGLMTSLMASLQENIPSDKATVGRIVKEYIKAITSSEEESSLSVRSGEGVILWLPIPGRSWECFAIELVWK